MCEGEMGDVGRGVGDVWRQLQEPNWFGPTWAIYGRGDQIYDEVRWQLAYSYIRNIIALMHTIELALSLSPYYMSCPV